jgi:hypothetical protein
LTVDRIAARATHDKAIATHPTLCALVVVVVVVIMAGAVVRIVLVVVVVVFVGQLGHKADEWAIGQNKIGSIALGEPLLALDALDTAVLVHKANRLAVRVVPARVGDVIATVAGAVAHFAAEILLLIELGVPALVTHV